MSQYVSPDVAEIRDNPTAGETVAIAIVPSGETSVIEDIVVDADGEIKRILPSEVIIAEIPEKSLHEVCETEVYSSISLTDRMRVLAS